MGGIMTGALDQGACRNVDPLVFDPVPGDEMGEARAKRYCRQCPVRLDCLALALSLRMLPGVWGGLTERERAHHQQTHDKTLQQRAGGRAAADGS
jgi:WhiB family redox-sensing transcriptional regulator